MGQIHEKIRSVKWVKAPAFSRMEVPPVGVFPQADNSLVVTYPNGENRVRKTRLEVVIGESGERTIFMMGSTTQHYPEVPQVGPTNIVYAFYAPHRAKDSGIFVPEDQADGIVAQLADLVAAAKKGAIAAVDIAPTRNVLYMAQVFQGM